ncbi:HutD family protein [Chania multitudinisentens RB-25]|uniref:HutD family protein n=1 Tax=Chania multitudinisentens RB-25 TaxID=1441930 RepID=W0LJY1_9GAMM|nr:HutD family protein [Chania multitudinisentens]AHG22295.1 HutD family protein [Chania multitudinisentens RB-25]
MSLNRFDFASLPVSPWRNGGGETREITSQPPGSVDFDWRASIATIAHDGPFSAFNGIDRSITLLEGDGVHLYSAGQLDHRLQHPGEPFAFSGDLALEAFLLGGSSQDFNIMTRRGRCRADVQRITAGVIVPVAQAGVLYVLQGEWQLDDGNCLGQRQGCWWQAQERSLRILPEGEGAIALWAAITSC